MKDWEKYEKLVENILNDLKAYLNIDKINSKKILKGQATNWEIDISAYKEKEDKIIIVECKKLSTRINQETMAGLAYRIKDLDAAGGIFVTTLGFQEGSKRIANKEKIAQVIIDKDDSPENYVAIIANEIFAKITTKALSVDFKVYSIGPISEVSQKIRGFYTKPNVKID